MPRITAHCALSGLKMHLYQRVIRACRPGKRSAAGQSRRVPRLCRMAADALSGLHYLAPGSAPFAGPASAAPPGNHAECRVCAGWRLTPYPAYVIWRRVCLLRRPGKRSAAGQYTRHRAAFVPDGGGRLIRPTLFGAGFRPLVGPASAAPPGDRAGGGYTASRGM